MKNVFVFMVSVMFLAGGSSMAIAQQHTNPQHDNFQQQNADQQQQQNAQQQHPQQQNTPPGLSQLSSSDQQFVDKAAKGGTYGLMLGNLGLEKAQSTPAKAFAEAMIQENQTMNTELGSIAMRKGISTVKPLDQNQTDQLQKLSQLTGKDFDQQFLSTALQEHQNTLMAFQQESKGGQDTALQHFAANTIPVLQTNIQAGKQAQNQLTASNQPQSQAPAYYPNQAQNQDQTK